MRIYKLIEDADGIINIEETITSINILLGDYERCNRLRTGRHTCSILIGMLDGLPITERKSVIAEYKSDDQHIWARTCFADGRVDGSEWVAVYSSREGWL